MGAGLAVFHNYTALSCSLDRFLKAAADLARRQWTQFGVASMGAGLAMFVAAVALQLAACWSLVCWTCPRSGSADSTATTSSNGGSGEGGHADSGVAPPGISHGLAAERQSWEWGVEGAAAAAAAGHAFALFSNSFILAQVSLLL